jgi:alpha-L-arabinofuranosidase
LISRYSAWQTQAEYRDIKVTSGSTVLYQKEIESGLNGWQPLSGEWRESSGSLQQTGGAIDCRATTGDTNWTDYTYRVRARKLGGAEGFLVMFHVQDRDNYLWWNIGGWGNTRSAIERSANGAKRELGRAAPVIVETGKWYDIRIEAQGRRIRCYLDDRLITEALDGPPPPVDAVFATASRDKASGDVIVKVVNVSETDQKLEMELSGISGITGGSIQVLAGQPADVNTLAEPKKVVPRATPLGASGNRIQHTFPAFSVCVLRVRPR